MNKLLLFVIFGTLLVSGDKVEAREKKNIVIILADDFGWKDAGFRGSSYYETPRLDAFAAASIEFTRAYACPSCSPTRAALLTGQYSPRHGVFMVGKSDKGNKTKQRLVPIPNVEALPPDTVTLAESLQAAGYVTALIGKWHLGKGESAPEKSGFQYNLGGFEGGTPVSYFSPYSISTLNDGPVGEYLTDRLTEEAVRFLRTEKNRAFFLYLAHYAVHVPLQARKEDELTYKNKETQGGQNNPTYAGMISSLDRSVGRVLDEIEALGLNEDTMVLFLSDNGGQIGITEQFPLREGKGWLTEGGVRIPMLMRMPGQTPGQCNLPVHVVDIYPSALEWANVTPHEGQVLDGAKLQTVLKNPSPDLANRDLFWHFPGYQPSGTEAFRITPSSMIVSGPWKLIEHYENPRCELFNVELDPAETHDLFAREPAIANQLKKRLGSWRQATRAAVPVDLNPQFVE